MPDQGIPLNPDFEKALKSAVEKAKDGQKLTPEEHDALVTSYSLAPDEVGLTAEEFQSAMGGGGGTPTGDPPVPPPPAPPSPPPQGLTKQDEQAAAKAMSEDWQPRGKYSGLMGELGIIDDECFLWVGGGAVGGVGLLYAMDWDWQAPFYWIAPGVGKEFIQWGFQIMDYSHRLDNPLGLIVRLFGGH